MQNQVKTLRQHFNA